VVAGKANLDCSPREPRHAVTGEIHRKAAELAISVSSACLAAVTGPRQSTIELLPREPAWLPMLKSSTSKLCCNKDLREAGRGLGGGENVLLQNQEKRRNLVF